MKISVEEKIKQIEKTSKSASVKWLVKELKRHRKDLLEICNNYYCRFDNGPFGINPYETHSVECPTCMAYKALDKKVKK